MSTTVTRQRSLVWLAVTTGVIALVIVVLMVLQIFQQRALRASRDSRADSVTALAFQLEREFLRLRPLIDAGAHGAPSYDLEDLRLRQELFASRYQLLYDTPSSQGLNNQPEYLQAMPLVLGLIERTDALLVDDRRPTAQELRQLLEGFDAAAPAVQALSLKASGHIAALMEEQTDTMLGQNQRIIALLVLLLVLLLASALALGVRQRRQEQQHRALEELSRRLQEANLAAESASRGKSQFLANMSHEVRTPFNGVLGMLNLLERTPLNTQQAEYVRTARGSADYLLTLLNDILDVSALEAGKMSIHPATVNLHQLFQDVQNLMQPLAHRKSLGFVMTLAPDVPRCIHADGTRIKQIVLNLVTNAIKFSDRGEVRVEVGPAPGGGATHRRGSIRCRSR